MRSLTLMAFLAVLFAQQAAAQSWALRLESGASYSFPHHSLMLTSTEFTFEAWVRSTPSSNGICNLFQRYSGSAEHKGLQIWPNGSVDFIYAGSPWPGRVSPPGSFPMDGDFHHVAAVRYPDDTWALYVDGATVLAGGPGPCWLTCAIIGTSTETYGDVEATPGNAWEIRGLHAAAQALYSGSFIPPQTFASGAATVLNVPLEQGAGAQIHDLGPGGQLGTLSGSYSWRRLCGPIQQYGVGCAGLGGHVPHLQVAGCPALSGSLTLEVTSGRGGSMALLLLGRDEAAIPVAGNCVLLVGPQPPFVVPVLLGGAPDTPGAGFFAMSWTLPVMAPLGKFTGQAVVLDRSNAWGYSASNGVAVTIN